MKEITEVIEHTKNPTYLNMGNTIAEISISRILAIALPTFSQKTGKYVTLTFTLNNQQELQCDLLFSAQPTQTEMSLLFDEIKEAEKLLFSKQILEEELISCDTVKKLEFRHTEILKNIISKKQNELNHST